MEYRGWQYRILKRAGADEWTWEVLRDGEPIVRGEARGLRRRAVVAAQRAIDKRTAKLGTRSRAHSEARTAN